MGREIPVEFLCMEISSQLSFLIHVLLWEKIFALLISHLLNLWFNITMRWRLFSLVDRVCFSAAGRLGVPQEKSCDAEVQGPLIWEWEWETFEGDALTIYVSSVYCIAYLEKMYGWRVFRHHAGTMYLRDLLCSVFSPKVSELCNGSLKWTVF